MMTLRISRLVAGLLLFCTVQLSVLAGSTCEQSGDRGCVISEGVASLSGEETAWARQMALRHALENAALRCNAVVSSHQQAQNFQLTRSQVSVRSRAVVRGFNILEEDADKEAHLYRVRIKACLAPAKSDCANPMAADYHPRVVILTPTLTDPYQARDLRELLPGWTSGLASMFRAQGYRNVTIDDLDAGFFPVGRSSPQLDPAVLERLQEDTGAQFALLTVFRDLSMAYRPDSPYLPDAIEQIGHRVARSYTLDDNPNTRSISVDWYLVDLNHARLVREGHINRIVRGEVRVSRDNVFGSAAFAANPTGQALLSVLQVESTEAMAPLKCAVLESRILEVRHDNGKKQVIFFATPESGLRKGDQLTAYHRQGREVSMGRYSLGADEVPAGFVRVVRVLDRFAVAEVVAEKVPLTVGDWVRSW